MIVGVPKEIYPGERRAALVPASVQLLAKAGHEVRVQSGVGMEAGYPDGLYREKGAGIAPDRPSVFEEADIILQVRGYGADAGHGKTDLKLVRPGQVLAGFHDPLSNPHAAGELAKKGVFLFALELMPRITRAQGMDALSSMATVSGYKAVLMAADRLPRMFPLMMTAAGTISPAKVFIVGAGVAGLQAVATARRLGAVVEAYDLRPAVKEQVESLGARFLEIPLEAEDAEGGGGYAKAMDEAFYKKQREFMGRVVRDSDVVVTTAAVPGKKAPVLVTADMVRAMRPGSVIVDLAAERGGNCELTRVDEEVMEAGVTILGPGNLPAATPYHASQMYGKNIASFLLHVLEQAGTGEGVGGFVPDLADEITRDTLVAKDGEVVHPAVKAVLEPEE